MQVKCIHSSLGRRVGLAFDQFTHTRYHLFHCGVMGTDVPIAEEVQQEIESNVRYAPDCYEYFSHKQPKRGAPLLCML